MSFETVIDLMVSNLGFSLVEDIILIVTFFACVVLFARDFKIGLLIWFMILALEYIAFSLVGMEVAHVLTLMIISLIMLSFSLFMTRGVGVN